MFDFIELFLWPDDLGSLHLLAFAAHLCPAQSPAGGVGAFREGHLLASLGGLGLPLPADLGSLDGIQPGVAGAGLGHDPALPWTRHTSEPRFQSVATPSQYLSYALRYGRHTAFWRCILWRNCLCRAGVDGTWCFWLDDFRNLHINIYGAGVS